MPDSRLLQIESLLGAALTNLSIASQMMQQMRKEQGQEEQQPKAEQDGRPKTFGIKARTARPTTAVAAESHESEGFDNAS